MHFVNLNNTLALVVLVLSPIGCGDGPEETTARVGQPANECSALGPTECAENSLCLSVYGGRVNGPEQCVEDEQFAACVVDSEGCDTAIFYARKPSGELWQFPSSCTPPEWTVEYLSENAEDWPVELQNGQPDRICNP